MDLCDGHKLAISIFKANAKQYLVCLMSAVGWYGRYRYITIVEFICMTQTDNPSTFKGVVLP